MNRTSLKKCVLASMLVSLLCAGVFSQSLTNKLAEEESFYLNFGKDSYTKLKIERDVIGLYDFFGEHIVDGVHLYDLSGNAQILSNEDMAHDSVLYSKSNEMAKKDFYQKFSNLVLTQDAIGGLKTSFIIGDQITTRFTPLTFNKTNFNGIRWDLWSTGLKFSFLLSRTRPGFLAKNGASGEALVEYPITNASFPGDYYPQGIRGDKDFSNKSPFGDYDLLWAFHAENTIASKVDIGVSYINNHIGDVHKTSVNPFKGYLPDSLMPKHVHFEFYDLTPEDTVDAGVFVQDVRMYVNNREVRFAPGFSSLFRRSFTGDRDGILLPRELPLARPQNGPIPIIVEFKIEPQYWVYKDDGKSVSSMRDIKRLKFHYTVAGNYQVFVSTDKQIPSSIFGEYNPLTRKVDYTHPSRSVGELYDDGARIDDNGQLNSPVTANYAATYFGEYICQAPRMIYISDAQFTSAVETANKSGGAFPDPYAYNYRSYDYDFNINESSVTYGVNFKGDLFGINFNGEVALNQSEDMLPGSDDSRITKNKLVGEFKARRDITKSLGISGEAYQIAPQWATSLQKFQASQYFNRTSYKQERYPNPKWSPFMNINDYSAHPRPLGDQYNTIDDNDDQDAFPESDRRHYPADMNASDDEKFFMNDGVLSWNSDTLKGVTFPNNMMREYDDPDGVIASKNDKNKNGVSDYMEDFLLFSSDPPVFELGIDLNNNGIPDYEDDDILPDYGHSVGYVVTGDGIKTQGIQGVNLALMWTPFENTTVEVGGITERILDRDIIADNTTFDEDVREGNYGQSTVGYLTLKNEVIKRQQGLQYELGNETRVIRDEIRNDAISGYTNRNANDALDVNYGYYIDPLDYRQAVVDNFIAGINYVNIQDLEYGARLKVGGELHKSLPDSTYYPYGYDKQWRYYADRTSANFHFVNRVKYTIRFDKEFEDWRSVFNFINRFELIPQYKIQYSMVKEISGPPENKIDPRSEDVMVLHQDMDIDHNGLIDPILDDYGDNIKNVIKEAEKWYMYESKNQSYFLNVPILRANFKIAENTQLQFGTQWARYFDMISPENNSLKFTGLAQVVSGSQYKGYSVTFYLGGKWYNYGYDVHYNDPVIGTGSRFNKQGYEFFAKLYSGI